LCIKLGIYPGLLKITLQDNIRNISNSSFDIATCYGLDSTGIKSWWGRDFPHPSKPSLEPNRPLLRRVMFSFSGGQSSRSLALTTHLQLGQVKERVQLYVYCPSGLSWPVIERTYVSSVKQYLRSAQNDEVPCM